ncbi:SGNH/GDSL hydrolase family protein [Oscillatoria salina]|uniref:SGNH/GDSL hydrolase family protein n=1 Tax=Oscillatoria salina TaxID=331517 RepID=UPI0013B91C67|nr:SGNH/GDSL hydrolase family protein [Oscillatoria salina]MBZ8182568.1 SGNH/GDSL hydrolase family protein [Oscillatoria salina IIICB1]NET88287.1 SGNH/GDSL hydrolase family protein [Kamptonema sp. SIO1D9]
MFKNIILRSQMGKNLLKLSLVAVAGVILVYSPACQHITAFAEGITDSQNKQIPNLLEDTQKIVIIGDSITELGGQPGGYVWLLERYLAALYPNQKMEIVNAGISGNKSLHMQERFQQDVLDKNPDLVFINVGVNDVWHAFYDFQESKFYPEGNLPGGVALPVYQEKLREMIQAANAAGVKVVLLSPTPIRENTNSPENQRLEEYVNAMGEIAGENRILFVNLYTPITEVFTRYQAYAGQTQNLLTMDGVHPNQAGNRIIAYTILKYLGVPESKIKNLEVQECSGLCP